MDGLRNLPELIQEFVTRQDYIAVYLSAVGVWCLFLALRGLTIERTQRFGWRPGEAVGREAVVIGRAWLAVAAALVAAGVGLWITS